MPPMPDIDAELQAMRACADACADLDADGTSRVVRWLCEFLDVSMPDGPGPVIDEVTLVRAAAGWAADVLDMLEPDALKQSALDGLSWGDSPDITAPLFEGIKAAWRVAAGTQEARALWPST